jgi:FkbM family methyltransferase
MNEKTRFLKTLVKPVSKIIPTGTIIPIFKGPLKGSKWIAGAAAGDGKGLSILFNLAEPAQLDMAKQLLKPSEICFDIGANVGFYTLLFSKYSKHVYSFEPLPRNIRYLYEIIELNHVNNVTIVPSAVSEKIELLSFAEGENCAVGKLDNLGNQPITSLSVDEFIERYKVIPSLIKIDVEGAEMSVLKGAQNLFINHHPKILLSIHSDFLRIQCLEFFKKMNYTQIVPLDDSKIEKATEFAFIF